jgi:hypothetical protein
MFPDNYHLISAIFFFHFLYFLSQDAHPHPPGENCMPSFIVITALIINNEAEPDCRLHN